MPPVQSFVRAEMFPSGYLIRPCEGGGCIIHIVDHVEYEVAAHLPVIRMNCSMDHIIDDQFMCEKSNLLLSLYLCSRLCWYLEYCRIKNAYHGEY